MKEPLVTSCSSVDYRLSDHFMVLATLRLVKPNMPSKTIQYRKITTVSPETLQAAIRASPLCNEEILANMVLGDLTKLYHTELRSILDRLAPLVTRTITMRPHAQWFTDDIRRAKQRKRQMERLWRKSRLTVHREMYVEAKNAMNHLIKETKRKYHERSVQSCGNNSKQLFQLVSSLLGPPPSPPLPSMDAPHAAQHLSDFFMSKVEKIQASIPPSNLPLVDASMEVITDLTNFVPIMPAALQKIIQQAATKHCDLDPMPTVMLKSALPVLIHVMTMIVNLSLSQGEFPALFKTALIAPRLKKTSLNQDDVNSYRPVSNLDFLSKVLEKVVSDQLTSHLARNNLHEPLQSAYRPRHSTETALARVHDDISRAMAQKRAVLLVLIDLSAAFDTVSHELLLQCLQSSGVKDTALRWFTSYLAHRQQIVTVNGHRSEAQPLNCGVPQGSVLGPILFNLYISSLGQLLRNHGVSYHLYADDAQVYIDTSIEELNNAKTRLETCVEAIQGWMRQRQLKMNDTKTEFIVFATRELSKRIPPCSLLVGEHHIPASKSVRNIGVVFDCNMSMEAHVSAVVRGAYLQLKNISRRRPFITRAVLECIVHAFVTSKLDFSDSVLCSIDQKLLQKFQVIQNAAARILIKCRKYDHITPVLHTLHWLPVSYRIRFKLCVLVYKCLNEIAPPYLNDLVNLHVFPRNTRNL